MAEQPRVPAGPSPNPHGGEFARKTAGRMSVTSVRSPGYELSEGPELDSIVKYQDNSFEINPQLRNPGYYHDDIDEDEITRLDKAVSRNKVDQELLYRTVPGQVVDGLVEGSTLKDKAFLSTSKSLAAAEQIGQDFGAPRPHILVIHTEKDLPGLDMNKQMAGSGLDNPFSEQKEVVLARGLTLRVIKAAPPPIPWSSNRKMSKNWPQIHVIVEKMK